MAALKGLLSGLFTTGNPVAGGFAALANMGKAAISNNGGIGAVLGNMFGTNNAPAAMNAPMSYTSLGDAPIAPSPGIGGGFDAAMAQSNPQAFVASLLNESQPTQSGNIWDELYKNPSGFTGGKQIPLGQYSSIWDLLYNNPEKAV